jgi:hypothetical protein
MEMPPMKRYSTDKQIQERYHFSPTSLWRKRRTDPRFPKPFRLHEGGPHLTPDDELDSYDEQLRQNAAQSESEGADA